MRRWAAMGLAMVITVCLGCTPKPSVSPETADFACDFTATYRDLQVAGELARYGAGTLSITFTAPETLEGVTAVWNGESVTFSLYGLSFSADPATLPETALGGELVAVLDNALNGTDACRAEGDTLLLEGTSPSGSYTLTCHGESGLPLALSVPSLPLTATSSYS